MTKKKDDETAAGKWAYLLKPAKNMLDNFDVDMLTGLNEYLNVIRHRDDEDGEESFDAGANYKIFNFAEACSVLQNSATIYSRKVDYIFDQTYGLLSAIDNSKDGVNVPGAKKGRKRKVDLGSNNFELFDIKDMRKDALKGWEKVEKEEKVEVDNLRLVYNADVADGQYERKHVRAIKPTQFMFGRNSDQFMRTDEQIYNSKARPEVIGKVKDFVMKRSEIINGHEMIISHDSYRKNVDEFTLPGAKWVPDNRELALHFGIADIQVELDVERRGERVSACGPFKDPLSGQQVVAPPRWYLEQEIEKERASSVATMSNEQQHSQKTLRDSQGSMAARLSQNTQNLERHRNIHNLLAFVEGANKNRPSTHLNCDLIDLVVDHIRIDEVAAATAKAGTNPDQQDMDYDMDYGAGGGMESFNNNDSVVNGGGDEEEEDYVEGLQRSMREGRRKVVAPWQDLSVDPMRDFVFEGDEMVMTKNKEVKVTEKDPQTAEQVLKKRIAKLDKKPLTFLEEWNQTSDMLQNHFYWRSSARLNPTNDWKIEALRSAILKEKKRKAKERAERIRECREKKNLEKMNGPRRRGAKIMVNFDEMEDQENRDPRMEVEMENGSEEGLEKQPRRTMGAEYDDVADDDLAEEVELSMLGGGAYDNDDVMPFDDMMDIGSVPTDNEPPQAEPLRFNSIEDEEFLTNLCNQTSSLFIDQAIPFLKKYVDNRTDKDRMAYEMAKAYESMDIARSTLQAQIDEWHEKLEPILEEGETRKEYDVHSIGTGILSNYENDGEVKKFEELCIGKPWYEVSRIFLSCLLMSNTKNVQVCENKSVSLDERINTMTVTLLSKKRHHEVFEQDGAL